MEQLTHLFKVYNLWEYQSVIVKQIWLRFFLAVILAGSLNFLSAQPRSFYIASDGNDLNTGLGESTPVKTLDKLNTIILKPGDRVLLKRGDVFYGQINVKQSGMPNSPIAIGAYGDGNIKPIVNGSSGLNNWVKYKRNIWVTSCSQCTEKVTGLYANGKELPIGRYPNADDENGGFLTVKDHKGKAQFTANQFLRNDWRGAEVVYRPNQWTYERSDIVEQYSDQLVLDGTQTDYEPTNNWGFFIQNSLYTLDEEGEWYYDKAEKKIYVYSKSDPNLKNIEITTTDIGVNLQNSNYIIVKDIDIVQNTHYAILAKSCSFLTVDNVGIRNCGENGISITGSGSSNIKLTNNNIYCVNNNGIEVLGPNNFVCRGNKLKNVGNVIGMSKGRNLQSLGILYVNALDTGVALIEKNQVDSVGYVGIRFQSSNITIQNNVISNIDLVKGDGGGIYTWNGDKKGNYKNEKILNNIIFNASGNLTGSAGWASSEPSAYGIYLDYCSQNVEVKNNTVFNCHSGGIFLLSCFSNQVIGNTCYNNGTGIFIQEIPTSCKITQTVVRDNIFFGNNDNQSCGKFFVSAPESFAVFSGNYYVSAGNNKSPFLLQNLSTSAKVRTPLLAEEWKSRFSRDLDSKFMNVKTSMVNSSAIVFNYNPSENIKVISLNGVYSDARGKVYSGKASLPPYSSVILFKLPS